MADVKLIPLQVLLSNPERAGVPISPDGKRFSYMAPLDGVMNVFIGDAGTGEDGPSPTTPAAASRVTSGLTTTVSIAQ
jgi:hypothetical protein